MKTKILQINSGNADKSLFESTSVKLAMYYKVNNTKAQSIFCSKVLLLHFT